MDFIDIVIFCIVFPFLWHLLSFGMYVWFNSGFAYDKKIENVFGRCRLIKYLLPFISTLIISFLMGIIAYVDLLGFYIECIQPIKDDLLGLFLNRVGGALIILFHFVIIFCLYSSIVYGWCWVGKCVKNVFGRRGLIIYCVISIILVIIAYIACIAYIVREFLA